MLSGFAHFSPPFWVLLAGAGGAASPSNSPTNSESPWGQVGSPMLWLFPRVGMRAVRGGTWQRRRKAVRSA